MPPVTPELKLLLDNVLAQIQQLSTRSDTLQTYIQAELDKLKHGTEIDGLKSTQAVQQEKIENMSDEIAELKKQLEDTKREILQNQQDNFKRTIYVQSSILLLILSTVIGVVVKVFFP